MDQAGFQPTIMTVLQEDGVYSFLVDNDDKIIMHPNKAYLPTEEKATDIKDYDGKHKLLIVSTVPSTNWKVGIVITAAVIASNKIIKPIITLTEIINRTKDFELKDKVLVF